MFKNKIILFMLLSVSILFGNSVKLEIIKSASPQYIEGNRTIHYTLTIHNTSQTNDYNVTTIHDDMENGLFTDANITITDSGGFTCDVNTSDIDSEITCFGMMEHDRVRFIQYDVIAPDVGRQVTNNASVYYGGSEIDTASVTVTVFPSYDGNLDYKRDVCYLPFPSIGEECYQSGSFFYGPDCNTSVEILRNPSGNTDGDILNVHIFKAYTSAITEDECYTEASPGVPAEQCGGEKDLDNLLHKSSSLYFKSAFEEAHDFSLGNLPSDNNRTIVDSNTIPVSGKGNNLVTSFQYIALIAQYNISGYTNGVYDSDNFIEEYIYPCDGGYSIPPPVTQLTTGGINDVDLTNEDITLESADYIDYSTYNKVGTKIVNQPFLLGITFLDVNGDPAVYDGEIGDSGKIINAALLLSYETNGVSTPIWSGELPDGESHILTLENFSNDEATQVPYPVIDKAFRSGKLTLQLVDYGSFFTAVDGINCSQSSLESGLCLLPACLNSARQILEVFPLENYPHVATCIYGDGGGASPCDSNAYTGNCSGKKETISPSKYDHDLGCMHCLADAVAPYRDSNPFSTRPYDFILEVPDVAPDDVKDDELYRAGVNYPIDLNATTGDASITQSPDYNTTLEGYYPSEVLAVIGLEHNSSLTCPYDTNESQTIFFRDGHSVSDINYSNVGKVKLVIMDQNWTSIDQDISVYATPRCIDSNETNPVLDPLHRGRVGCKLITEKSMTFVPYDFGIDANLTDHNTDNNFTYLHDINQYDLDDNYSMAAKLSIFIEALNKAGDPTSNYIEECYAKETNLTLILSGDDITYPSGQDAPLTHFLYYNPLEDNGSIDSGEGNYTLLAPAGNTITISSLDINNTEASFSADAPEGNGTARIEYKLNFDRKIDLVANPFKIILSDINITDTDEVKEGTVIITDKNATYYYARSRASKFFYEDITEPSVITPNLIDVYCALSTTDCSNIGIDTVSGAIDDINWYISRGHTANDGNITLMVGNPLIEGTGSPTINGATYPTPTDITNWSTGAIDGADDTVNVAINGSNVPLTVPIELVRSSDTPTPSIYSNEWLIYNPKDPMPLSPFYKVRFIGEARWTGEGQTGHVVDVNASYKKSQRVDW